MSTICLDGGAGIGAFTRTGRPDDCDRSRDSRTKARAQGKSIEYGSLTYAIGLIGTALSTKVPKHLVISVLVASLGCIAVPALIAFIANQAASDERGAVLGGIETLNELCLALAHSTYGRTLALFISTKAPVANMPGAPFFLGAAFLIAGLGVMVHTFGSLPEAAAQFL